MTIGDYLKQKFQSFGIRLSEADLLDILSGSKLGQADEMTDEFVELVHVGIANFIPSLLLRPTSISENGFSLSWNEQGLKEYYAYLCSKYGLEDKINTDKPTISFL